MVISHWKDDFPYPVRNSGTMSNYFPSASPYDQSSTQTPYLLFFTSLINGVIVYINFRNGTAANRGLPNWEIDWRCEDSTSWLLRPKAMTLSVRSPLVSSPIPYLGISGHVIFWKFMIHLRLSPFHQPMDVHMNKSEKKQPRKHARTFRKPQTFQDLCPVEK